MIDKSEESAFPVYDASNEKWNGMSLRDYFAAKALPSIIQFVLQGAEMSTFEVAIDCYMYADAMLKARER